MSSIWTHVYKNDFQLKFYDVKGIKTRCLEAGSGEPLILLHGIGGHLEAYARNITAHAENGFHVYAIDMIGHGFTDKVIDYDLTLPVYTEHLLNFMDTVGIDKASISGESLGGWVAGWFAWEHPERVNKIVLNTSGGLTMYPEVMKRLKTLTLAAIENPEYETVKKRLEFLMHDPADVSDELVKVRQSIYEQPDMLEGAERILCLQEKEIRQKYLFTEEQLTSIQAPACIIWTDHDPTAAAEIGEKFSNLIPNSEFHLMKGCGHWPQYEDAETFNQIHIDFLQKK